MAPLPTYTLKQQDKISLILTQWSFNSVHILASKHSFQNKIPDSAKCFQHFILLSPYASWIMISTFCPHLNQARLFLSALKCGQNADRNYPHEIKKCHVFYSVKLFSSQAKSSFIEVYFVEDNHCHISILPISPFAHISGTRCPSCNLILDSSRGILIDLLKPTSLQH